jgi:chromosome segregation ATPase
MNASSKNDHSDEANARATHVPIDPASGDSSQASPAVSRVVTVCPICKATLSVRSIYLGNPIRCKQCSQVFTVPAALETPARPAGDAASGGAAFERTAGSAPQDDVKPGSQRASIGAQSVREQLAGLVAQQNSLRSAYDQLRAEHDDLRADRDKLKLQEVEVRPLRAERDSLAAKLAELGSELDVARSEIARLNQRIEESDTDLEGARQEREQLSQQLALSRSDFSQARADQLRMSDERQDAFEKIERLTQTLAERELMIRNQSDHFDAELERARKAWDLVEKSHLEERQSLTTELAAVRARNQELQEEQQSTEALCAQLRESNQELVEAHARRESGKNAMPGAEHARPEQLADEVLASCATAGETSGAGERLNSANLNPPGGPYEPAAELEAARARAEELQWKLAEAEYRCRVMAETLNRLGVSVDVLLPTQGKVETRR